MDETVSAHLSDFFNGKITPEAFEQWIGQTPELKELVTEDDYFRLVSTDFKVADARHSLEDLLRKYIDWAQYEKEKLSEVLMCIIWKDKPIDALLDTYQRYTNGQRFLQTLGYKYGKLFTQAEAPRSLRRKLTSDPAPLDHDALFEKHYPELKAEATRLLGLLVADRIRFTGTYTVGGCAEYTED
ncbi:hypothetical protein ACAW74_05185 [Fibrella sp. WM1]